MRRIVLLAAAAASACLFAATAHATVIFFDDFSGTGLPLHGQAPTVDNTGLGNTWVTRADADGNGLIFFDNGTINAAGAASGSATLAFTPSPGLIYTLTASFGAVAAGGENWVALGFAGGQSTASGNPGRFITPPTAAQPWMIYRGDEAMLTNQAFLGPGTADGGEWSTPVTPSPGAPVDLKIVLDTRPAAWTAEWFAKNPGDADYTSVRFDTYTTNPTIGGVGIAAAAATVISTIHSFELTVVPEPNAAVMGLGIALAGLWLRRGNDRWHAGPAGARLRPK